MGNPNLESPQDVKRLQIVELCEQVAAFDPEFILKVKFLELVYVWSSLSAATTC